MAADGRDIVEEGDTVMLWMNDGDRFFPVVAAGVQTQIRKQTVFLSALIGAEYGTVYELVGSSLHIVASGDLMETIIVDSASGLDNRHVVDSTKSQKLSTEAICEIKAEGRGSDVVAALVANSSTFSGKTAFAQQKYIKKKQLKHVARFRILRPTALDICDSLLQRQHQRLCGLRGDALGQLLCGANIRFGCRALILDGTGGVVIGAAVERMGYAGLIVAPMEDEYTRPAWMHVPKFNLGHVRARTERNLLAGNSSSVSSCAAAAGAASETEPATKLGSVVLTPLAPSLAVVAIKFSQLAKWGGVTVAAGSPAALQDDHAERVAALEAKARRVENLVAATAATGVASSSVAPAASKGGSWRAVGRAEAKRRKAEERPFDALATSALKDADASATPSAGAKGAVSAGVYEPSAAANAEDGADGAVADPACNAAEKEVGVVGADLVPIHPASCTAAARLRCKGDADPGVRHRLHPLAMADADKRQVMQHGFDSVVISTPYEPAALALAAARFARPSASLAIFCREMQPLAVTLRVLRAAGVAVNLTLAQTWYRPYQVLPERTHPAMVMHGAGGYVLLGTFIAHPFSAVVPPVTSATRAAIHAVEADALA